MKTFFFNRFFFVLFCLFSLPTIFRAQTKVSILGDSYSTFVGHVTPETNLVWYGVANAAPNYDKNNVHQLDQTWWQLLLQKMDAQLEINNSYSGSTVCLTGYEAEDYSDRAFITRVHNLGNPDVILIFGGTNDAWASVPLGEYQYEKWTHMDLFSFRPAFAYLLNQLMMLYPETKIYNISNCHISEDVIQSMDTICTQYGILNIKLEDIQKEAGHPSVEGMQAIADQIFEAIK